MKTEEKKSHNMKSELKESDQNNLNSSNEEFKEIVYKHIEGTMFTIVQHEDEKWRITIGNDFASNIQFGTEGEARMYIELKPWELIITTAIALNKANLERYMGGGENKEETKEAEAETETENKGRDIAIAKIKEEGWGAVLDNTRKEWELRGNGNEGESTYYEAFKRATWITETPNFNQREAIEIMDIAEDIEGKRLDRMLRREEAEREWQKLVNELKNGEQSRAESTARELAYKWGIGEYKNWKTWTETGTKALGAVAQSIGQAAKITK